MPVRKNKDEMIQVAQSILIRIDNGETKAQIAEDHGVTVRTVRFWIRAAYGPYKKSDSLHLKVHGHEFSEHKDKCQFYGCGLKAGPPLKTGFKDGSPIGQWKAYCQTHGFVYYNLEK